MSNSGKVVNFPERAQIEEEAARWVVRHDNGELSDIQRAEFEAWRQTSAQHNETFNRLRGFWSDMDVLAGLSNDAAPAPLVSRPAQSSWMAGGLVAAACLLVAIVIAAQALNTDRALPAPGSVQTASVDYYSTAVGDQERLTLSDGSTITLNTASQIEVRMTPDERSVRLLEGEAFFEVAHDAARPFNVYARDGVTRAVGTAFSVRLHDDGVEVLVSEGKVSFATLADPADNAPGSSPAEPVAFISAGQSATFSDKVKLIETVEAAEVDRKLAWREGKLVFEGDPLSSVVADISRYTGVEIEITDPALAGMRVGGLFEVGEVDSMLASLEAGFDLHVERVSDTHVRISAQTP